MLLIGINEGMNSSVVVCKDGEITFAIQEERLNKIKEYVGFPTKALTFTLEYCNIDKKDITGICLSNDHSPYFTRDEFRAEYDKRLDTSLKNLVISGLMQVEPNLIKKIRRKLVPQLFTKTPNKTVEQQLKEHGLDNIPLHRSNHHLNHAAAAYFGMRYNATDPHLVLTLDGGGDGDCANIYIAQNGKLELIAKTEQGHSIGNIYSNMTHCLGMNPHEHEYKLMGLAAYAKPEYCKDIIDIFNSYIGLDSDNPLCFKRKISEPTHFIGKRLQKDFNRKRFDNVCGGMQFFTEQLLLRWVKAAIEKTGIKKVVAAGGVFMNVKANKLIAEQSGAEFFNVLPSCGDETLPFGAVWHYFAEHDKSNGENIKLKTFCLGPSPTFDLQEAKEKYSNNDLVFTELKNPLEDTAELINQGKIVARCSGPMEFGARALGNRSLIADAAQYSIIPTINKMIKKRDFWMPFAPVMLKEVALDYLKIPAALPEDISPYMMQTFDTKERREEFVAGVHAYDATARAQTVTEESNPELHKLLKLYQSKSGKGVTLNTSYNLHGLPIAMGALDAIHILLNSGLSHLVIENCLITKSCS